MQKHWSDIPHEDPSNDTSCPVCQALDTNPPPLAAGHATAGAVPFVMLRGHWLEQMGFGVGATVRIAVAGTRLTLDVVPDPNVPATTPPAGVPTQVEREVHFTEVEAHTHHDPTAWSDR
jgi:hypothetical protein